MKTDTKSGLITRELIQKAKRPICDQHIGRLFCPKQKGIKNHVIRFND